MKPKVVDLGWCMARLDGRHMSIFCPSNAVEGIYTPPSDVTVYGEEYLILLRDALNELLPPATQNAKVE